MEGITLSPMLRTENTSEGCGKLAPVSVPEIRKMLKIISFLSWINLLIGLPSVLLVLNLKSFFLFGTGVLAIFTFWLLRMIVRHIIHSKSWAEVGVIAMCGVYFPAYIMWLCGLNLIEAILK